MAVSRHVRRLLGDIRNFTKNKPLLQDGTHQMYICFSDNKIEHIKVLIFGRY